MQITPLILRFFKRVLLTIVFETCFEYFKRKKLLYKKVKISISNGLIALILKKN